MYGEDKTAPMLYMIAAVAYSSLTIIQTIGFIGGAGNWFKYGITAQFLIMGFTCIAPIITFFPGV